LYFTNLFSNFDSVGVDLDGRYSVWGLPNFVNSYLNNNLLETTISNFCFNKATAVSTVAVADSVLWDFGDPTSGINNTSASIVSEHLCADTGKYVITLYAYIGANVITQNDSVQIIDVPVVSLGEDTTLCDGKTKSLVVSFNNNASFLWQDGSSDSLFQVTQNGVYWVTASNFCGSAGDTVEINYRDYSPKLELPNVLTINGDGINEVLIPINAENLNEYHMTVSNRWGKLMFESDELNLGWNGTYKGRMVSEGYYYWVISYVDLDENHGQKNGFLMLKR
jgi:gliding motility-associated-like protein